MKNKDNLVIRVAIAILCFFTGITFVNNWLVLNKNYPSIGVFDVPFRSEIWGTVSDWAMVIVTIVTATYIVRTFKEQQIITKIEAYRYKQDIMPSFVLEQHMFSETITEDYHYKVVCDFDFININQMAKNIQIRFDENCFKLIIPVGLTPLLYQNEKISMQFVTYLMPITAPLAEDPETGAKIATKFWLITDFNINYEDAVGNKYLQIIQFEHKSPGNQVIINNGQVKSSS